jgi:hypothetical protein
MCDALSRNVPKSFATLLANCLTHGRRNFVEVTSSFPEECRFVLETLGEVYGYDNQARTQGLSPEQRLHFHQEHSVPVMEKLKVWLGAQFAERKVEPNSGLGKAISYLLNHWEKLTLFLQVPGAPLDNNIAERALKKADPASQELAVLQESEWGADGRPVHECDSHLRVKRGQSFRLSQRVTARRRRAAPDNQANNRDGFVAAVGLTN